MPASSNDDKVLVSAGALEDLLRALNGPAHYIKELVATRFIPGNENNPLNVLEQQHRDHLAEKKASDREKSRALSFIPPKSSKLDDLIERALMEPTLIHALSWMSIWDTTRAVDYVKENPGKPYDTLSLFLFEKVTEAWNKKNQGN